ncbi:pre-tRNA nuclear export protein [Cryomyces antarcticus]|uniref:Exportin-T n=1 Tax=Cryomyces antarcticus TaxID=329879 RepID=A0ABR0LR90_9PEZI|nr:pre-tRNA nuclear export protein [Cryomyces antarcticus]
MESVIQIAVDPTADQNLKSQAFNFLSQVREDRSAWRVCLSLFVRSPQPAEVVRHVALEIVNNAVQTQHLDAQDLNHIRDNLTSYIRQTYVPGAAQGDVDPPHIQNKLTQTITYLFTALYASGWDTFFDDFRGLAGDATTIGSSNVASTMLYLRILGSVHDEIADIMISRLAEEKKRNGDLKDLVRARDAHKIALSWQEILAKWRQTDLSVIEMCLKTVSRWVSWIDISLVVNESMLNVLFQLAGQQGISSGSAEGNVRDAAIDTFTETVGKKMKAPDKIELIFFLNVSTVVGQLVSSPSLSELRSTSNYDTDLAETVAKLVNNTVFDIVKVLDSEPIDDQTRSRAEDLLQNFVPYLLRFFSDEYDEICSTVISSLADLLTLFRKIVKSKGGLPPQYSGMLQPIMDAIVAKMKYDETSSWGREDEQTDEAEFQELRKRLHVLQQAVAAVDETLYINTLSRIVGDTFSKFGTEHSNLNWRDLDLAMHEMFLFGELAVKNGGLYQKSVPSSVASERLIEMMSKMVKSDLACYPHPSIQLQYMEICVRYCPFFEQHPQTIPGVLENFVRFVHSEHIKVRTRSWYLFHRFVRHLRSQLGNVSQTVIQAIGDLLVIRAELPEDSGDDDMSSEENDQSADALFNNQLFLFEAIGCLSSTSSVPVENKVIYTQSVVGPLCSDLQQSLEAARAGDERAVLQIHHIIMALGTLARGSSDWMPGATSGTPPPNEVSEQFVTAAEAVLLALESLSSSINIRTAARFAFSRLMGVLGSRVLQQLPRWIDGLLSQSSTKDEMAAFLRLLDQIVFGFKGEIFVILDSLLTPLLQRVFSGLAEPTTGTDDEIQLAELRREYLNFLLVILNNDLGSVLVSSPNQSTFETIISTIEYFARDASDYPTARLAVSVLVRMSAVWGGPDIPNPSTNNQSPYPSLPGFDQFIITRFSPICWALPSNPSFNAKDMQARQVLSEVASLQQMILLKTGQEYLTWLRDKELREMGLQGQVIDEYLRALTGDAKAFKQFFLQFVSRNAQ